MKVLYYSPQPLKDSDGVTKKVYAQIEGMENIGHQTGLISMRNDGDITHLCYNDDIISENAFDGHVYDRMYDVIKNEKFDVIYIRYVASATPLMLSFLRKIDKLGVKILVEIPTYPYDGEREYANIRELYRVLRERVCRRFLRLYVDKIVTTSEFDTIFGVPCVKVSNAISIVPPIRKPKPIGDSIKFVSVANVAFWHGYDRIILGMKDYYKSNPKIKVFLDIIGDGDKEYMRQLNDLVSCNSLEQYVRFPGPKSGEALDDAFVDADLAIGCLGCHRKKITEVKSLKNVEYAMRGIPFVYSEQNADFDGRPYVLKVPADDTPIDIDNLIRFLMKCRLTPTEIHNSVEDMTWDNQMRKIFVGMV